MLIALRLNRLSISLTCALALLGAFGIAGITQKLSLSHFNGTSQPAQSDVQTQGALPQFDIRASATVTSFMDQPMCRFGVAEAQTPLPITNYDPTLLRNLRAGWYLNFTTLTSPPRPSGMEFAQMVRMHQAKPGNGVYTTTYVVPYTYTTFPNRDQIGLNAQANPGSLWLLGNEIERRDWRCSGNNACTQDEMLPEVYADAYHDLYNVIKSADPTARIAIGGVIEITDLRLKYLDRVWNSYRSKYGQPMPVDVWNMHPYPLPEVVGGAGADIPAGLPDTIGTVYSWSQNDSLDLLKSQVVKFRTWMAAKGQSNKPLVISEYGVLLPTWFADENGNFFTDTRVKNYMYGAFDYFLTAKDAALGYKADDNRLIQQWNWFSLDNDPQYINGPLISYTVGTLTPLGQAWKTYVTDPVRPFGPPLNLKMLSASYQLLPSAGAPYTASIKLQVSNSGFLNWTDPLTVQLSTVGGTPLAQTVINGQPGCGRTSVVTFQVNNLPHGVTSLKAQIDPSHLTPDVDFQDNSLIFPVIIAPENNRYLPLLLR